MDNESEWLQQLKPGDEVLVTQSYGREYLLFHVSRVTRTQVIIEIRRIQTSGSYERRFNRVTGREVGGGYDCQYLRQPTKQRKEQAELAALKAQVTTLRGKLGTPNDRPTLEAMIKALTPFVKKEI